MHAVWTAIADMFGAQSRANVRHIRRQLQSLRKDDMSAAEYMHKMKALADTMAVAGSPVRDDELIDHILTGLGSAYNSITASLGVSNAPMPYSSFTHWFCPSRRCRHSRVRWRGGLPPRML